MRGLRAALIGIVLSGAALAEQDPSAQNISLSEARGIARAALLEGNPRLALQIARGLLEADLTDPDAYLIASVAQNQLRNHARARRAARLAYRHSDIQRQKLDAAQIAAGSALAEGRPTLTQIWLRRALLHTDSDQDSQAIAKDYARVRAANPWGFHLDVGLRPSSNVNNGSDTALQVIDGVPLVGVINGAGRALSGWIGTTDLTVGYRLRGNADTVTTLGGRLYVQRVHLSDEARDIAPDAENEDFGSTYADLALRHAFRVGETGSASITGRIGASWYGGEPNYRLAQLDGQRRWRISEASAITLSGQLLHRDVVDSGLLDNTSLGLRGTYATTLANGDGVSVSIRVQDTSSDHPNNQYRTVSLSTRYSFGKAMGPAKVSAGLALAATDYPDYVSGFIVVPGGRQDESAYATLNLFFPDLDYAGFAPEVTFQAGKRRSNVSRFDSTQFSVSLGIQSKF